MTGETVVYTARCDRCGRDDALWAGRRNSDDGLLGPSSTVYDVRCPHCDPKDD